MYGIRVGTGDGAVAVAHPTAKAAVETLKRAEEEGQEHISIYTRDGKDYPAQRCLKLRKAKRDLSLVQVIHHGGRGGRRRSFRPAYAGDVAPNGIGRGRQRREAIALDGGCSAPPVLH